MKKKQKKIIADLDKRIISQEKFILKLKKYPNQKSKISIFGFINLELENHKIIELYNNYSYLREFIKVLKFL